MEASPQPSRITPAPPKPQQPAKPPIASILVKSVVAGVAIAGVTATVILMAHGEAPWPVHAAPDNVSQADQQARSDAFAAMGAVPLSVIPDQQVDAAIDGMQLPAPQRDALKAAVHVPAAKPAVQGPPAQVQKPTTPKVQPVAAPTVERVRLAWLTLWDTDVQDGDVVRIESRGYTRTVPLTKAPVTFAIPVPDDGVVKVVGVSDGDGGGITVGLASGGSKAVFPIMSDGQALGLRVMVNN